MRAEINDANRRPIGRIILHPQAPKDRPWFWTWWSQCDHAEDLTVMAVGLILSGGAPVLTFMAGALVALDERNVKFDVISTSGAGMLVGLLYAAPKRRTGDIKRDRAAALKNTVNMGVSDEIYGLLPVNFKVFYKPGLLADLYRQWLADVYRQWLRLFTPLRFADPRVQRYVTDLWALAFANLSPAISP
jgi:NTE family protein